MASGLRHDPYSQPREFMDDILGMMKETFGEHVAEVKQEIAAKLSEVDAALAALNDVKAQREQSARLECLHLASKMAGGADMICATNMAKRLSDFVLTGTKPGTEG